MKRITWRLCAVALFALPGMAGAQTASMQGGTGSAQAEVYVPMWQSEMPVPTEEQLARAKAATERPLVAAPFDANPDLLSAPGSRRLQTKAPPDLAAMAGPEPQAPGSFTIFRDSNYGFSGGSLSTIMEPSHATVGKWTFVTGNWFAARHTLVSGSWTYINPYADFPDFCCDQDVVYDRGRNIMIWYRQGIQLAGGNNNVKLSVSRDRGITWYTYTFTYTNFNGLPLGWFDYPHLAVTNNYLYYTTNYFNTNGTFQRMIINKISLDELLAGSSIGFTWWSRTTGYSWAPAQGGSEVAYFGDHNGQTAFNVCDQPEANSTLSCRDVAVAAWAATGRGSAVCTDPSGYNPCARLDQRVNAGYVRRNGLANEVGFFWTVKQNGNFPYPYVEAVRIDPSNWTNAGRPLIYNPSFAFAYAGASPNNRGDLGITTYIIGGGFYPYLVAGIDDDYNGTPPGWELAGVEQSNGTPGNVWGDYTRVRMNYPMGTIWTATGHVIKGGVPNGRQVFFGRERDRRGWDEFKPR